jgi:hypothetical protein
MKVTAFMPVAPLPDAEFDQLTVGVLVNLEGSAGEADTRLWRYDRECAKLIGCGLRHA